MRSGRFLHRQMGAGESDEGRDARSSDIVGESKAQSCERTSCVLRTTNSLAFSRKSMVARNKTEQKGPKI